MAPHLGAATVGVGVDLLHLPRIAHILDGPNGATFARRTFTPAELAESRERPDRVRDLAMRFAAKEAVFKSLSTNWKGADGFVDIQIALPHGGVPRVELGGHFRASAEEDGITGIALSISEDGEFIVAVAVALREADRPARRPTER